MDDEVQGRITVKVGQTAQGKGQGFRQGRQIIIFRTSQTGPVHRGHQEHFPGKPAGPGRQTQPAVIAANHPGAGFFFGRRQIA